MEDLLKTSFQFEKTVLVQARTVLDEDLTDELISNMLGWAILNDTIWYFSKLHFLPNECTLNSRTVAFSIRYEEFLLAWNAIAYVQRSIKDLHYSVC